VSFPIGSLMIYENEAKGTRRESARCAKEREVGRSLEKGPTSTAVSHRFALRDGRGAQGSQLKGRRDEEKKKRERRD